MINKFVEKIMEKIMKKETELIRVSKSIKQDRFTFYIDDKNVILDSIKVWGYHVKFNEEDELSVQIHISPFRKIQICTDDSTTCYYDYFILKYEVIKETNKFTIEAKDYINSQRDSKGNYTFYMEKNTEVNI